MFPVQDRPPLRNHSKIYINNSLSGSDTESLFHRKPLHRRPGSPRSTHGRTISLQTQWIELPPRLRFRYCRMPYSHTFYLITKVKTKAGSRFQSRPMVRKVANDQFGLPWSLDG